MKLIRPITTILSIITFATFATANTGVFPGTSELNIQTITINKAGTDAEGNVILISNDHKSGCGWKDAYIVKEQNRKNLVLSIGMTAVSTGNSVEILTDGCDVNYGKISYISLVKK
ncbi:MAG: hypothetical protein OCC49_20120 [Fibrobacterales bacterium]